MTDTEQPASASPTTDINREAPVVAEADIEIDARPEQVWQALVDVERWPQWNPGVKSVSLDGPLVETATFRWKAGMSTITSTVVRLDSPYLIAWTGKTLGIRAFHVWRLEPIDVRTLVRTEESYEGPVARILRRPLQKILERTLADGVRHLKAEAELSAQRLDSQATEQVR